ncbi:hypothetical protein [Argonema antarcticum]|uniref:hypothetical protein n=1 Tax=Argonema antarcticum TaxID=2942763 RepID=UPI002011EE7F|nr:hypothetical protein [Argonema antarcticum]
MSVVSGKNQDFQSNHWQFLVLSYFRHPALGAFLLRARGAEGSGRVGENDQ